jgi:murein DD-endopeptidase MepM/ murein hydrolase activator NlpD
VLDRKEAAAPMRRRQRMLHKGRLGSWLLLTGFLACALERSSLAPPYEEGPPLHPAPLVHAPPASELSAPPEPVAGFLLPLLCGATARVTQGNASPYSHKGKGRYAYDFDLERGTPLAAIAEGIVLAASGATRPGDACWEGGGPWCANEANYVLLEHEDGSSSLYMHLDAPLVAAGDLVAQGDVIGLSGGTGWSTGPHAHVQRQALCGAWWCQSLETRFDDVVGGEPAAGDQVVSQNCTAPPSAALTAFAGSAHAARP